jgi:signal transduction histidine kinase
LTNLILNASDAMSGKGTIILRSGTMEELPEGLVLKPAAAERYVYIAVQDSGCGIAPETLSRIFEPFFTTKSFSSRRGTGLGLSMVYEFAKELGVGLRVESVQGQGSTFTLILPARPSDSEEGNSTTNNADE